MDGPDQKYRLHIGQGTGTLPVSNDAMPGSDHSLNNMYFTTFDHDNDAWSSGTCAGLWKAAWWYRNCAHSSLNGPHTGTLNSYQRIKWYNGSKYAREHGGTGAAPTQI